MKETTLKEMLAKKPEKVIELAVKGSSFLKGTIDWNVRT